ncbi:hypothetical protein [Gemmatimonas sp.]|uniref:hypothetical protein n=1 Tax=Gemmatimonas sp. TaxID=1962908 RepID=UPI00286E3828|nr:hypothetical protein [Gemmatimonas sp.]
MRVLLLGMLLATGVMIYRPWQYTWAFGQDAGAARSADWKDKPCTKALAASLYDDNADANARVAGKQDNRFFIPGSPGHMHYVYGFRSQKACEEARAAMGTAQWDQSTR